MEVVSKGMDGKRVEGDPSARLGAGPSRSINTDLLDERIEPVYR